jgi:acetyltransferase-like isoleucine patch superfamily enzyme
MPATVHPTAEVSPKASLGEGTRVWHHAQVREGARIGDECIVGKGVYVDFDVKVGSRVKIQNGAALYHGCTIEDGVFVGPGACFTNDKFPRAINVDGSLKGNDDWEEGKTHVSYGASVGAGAIVLPGVSIGRFAVVGSGAVVSRSIPDYGIVLGVPARLAGFACACGRRLEGHTEPREVRCRCGRRYRITTDAAGPRCASLDEPTGPSAP